MTVWCYGITCTICNAFLLAFTELAIRQHDWRTTTKFPSLNLLINLQKPTKWIILFPNFLQHIFLNNWVFHKWRLIKTLHLPMHECRRRTIPNGVISEQIGWYEFGHMWICLICRLAVYQKAVYRIINFGEFLLCINMLTRNLIRTWYWFLPPSAFNGISLPKNA